MVLFGMRREDESGEMARDARAYARDAYTNSQFRLPPFFFGENPLLNAVHHDIRGANIVEQASELPYRAILAKGSVRRMS